MEHAPDQEAGTLGGRDPATLILITVVITCGSSSRSYAQYQRWCSEQLVPTVLGSSVFTGRFIHESRELTLWVCLCLRGSLGQGTQL